MKLINIIKESPSVEGHQEVEENAGVLFKRLLSNVANLSIATLKKSKSSSLKLLADDITKIMTARTVKGVKTADELVVAMAKGNLTGPALGDVTMGFMKTKDVSRTQIARLAPDFVETSAFIRKYTKEGNPLTAKSLSNSGYSKSGIEEILKAAKQSNKFQTAKSALKSTKTVKGTIPLSKAASNVAGSGKVGFGRKLLNVFNKNKSAIGAGKVIKTAGNTSKVIKMVGIAGKLWLATKILAFAIPLGIAGYIMWNWDEWTGDGNPDDFIDHDFEPEANFLKCILIPLADDEGAKVIQEGNTLILHYTKGTSYDDQGGLIFRVDGSVKTGDGSKSGTWSCNTSGLALQEQSTGDVITSKQLSIVIDDLNDNLMGDFFEGDSTDMSDALKIVKGIEGKTYKGATAIKTLIHNYPKIHGNSLKDDIENLVNLDFEGLERKEELLSILGITSGSGGGNKQGDSDIKGDGNTSTGIGHITIKWGSGGGSNGGVKFVQCTDLPFKYGCISDKIISIQKCLPAELKPDGYYGPKTSNALWNLYQGKEKGDITKEVFDKVMVDCKKKNGEDTPGTERKKVEPVVQLKPKGIVPIAYDTEKVIEKIDPKKMASDLQKTIDGRRVTDIIDNQLSYSGGRYVLKVDDELTENQLNMINLYLATKGFKVLRKKRETLDGSKYIWKADSKETKKLARLEKSTKSKEDKADVLRNNMNKELIQEMVRKTLNERYSINERFLLILENEDKPDSEKLDDAIQALADLEKQGMSDEEIEGSLDENFMDKIGKYLYPGGNDDSVEKGNDITNMSDNAGKVKSGFMSQVREYVIRKMFGLVGFNGGLADALSAGFADLGISEIIGMFKGGGNCEKHGPKIADAVLEGVMVYLSGSTDKNSIAFNFMRNTLSEYVKGSQIGEVLAGAICNVDIKGSLSKLKTSVAGE